MSNERSWTYPEPRLRFGSWFQTQMPEGPWRDEPDKIQWLDDETDLDCLIVRNSMGALCGYVGVPPEHPWYGRGYSECLDADCTDEWCYQHSPEGRTSVHGGLTFAAACSDTADESTGICHVPLPGRTPHIWWFGFDCAHAGDLSPYDIAKAEQENFRWPWIDPRSENKYRDVAYVKVEVANLARQLKAVG